MLELRKASQQEVKAISKLARRSEVWCYPSWIYALLILFSCLFVLKKNQKIIGYICFLTVPIFRLAYILQIAIHPRYQGKRLGPFILDWTLYYLKEVSHSSHVALHTIKTHVMHWMQRRGFRIAARYEKLFWLMHRAI